MYYSLFLALLRTLHIVVATIRRGRTLRQSQALGGALAPDVCARMHAHIRQTRQPCVLMLTSAHATACFAWGWASA